MSIYTIIAYCIWFVMFIIWTFGRRKNKQTTKKYNLPLYFLLYMSYVLLFVTPIFNLSSSYLSFGLFGDLLCLIGGIIAIWARIVLGRNWSALAVRKDKHELIQSGPYKIVRHPIYLGFILAMLGFSLTVGTIVSYFAAALGLISLIIRIPVEEKIMNEIFQNSYNEYSLRVKRIIPFIW